MFSRQSNNDEDFENLFSVATSGNHQHLNARSIVSYHGVDTGNGVWKCSKDRIHQCIHINLARDHFQKLITSDPSTLVEHSGPNVAVAPGTD